MNTEERLNRAYSERNIAVIALAKMALLAGYKAGKGIDIGTDFDPEWSHVVYIELPNKKQISFRMAPSEIPFLKELPIYKGKWDGTFHGRNPEYLFGWKQKKKNILKRFIAWRTKCTHNDYIVTYECYRYIECKCSNCGETFLKGMDE